MEQTTYFNDFIAYINDNMVKVQELLEKVTVMHYEITKILLETCTLFHPQILIELNEMEINGRKYDDYILDGQEMKTKLSQLTSKSHNTAEEYRQIMEEIGIIDSQMEAIRENVCNP